MNEKTKKSKGEQKFAAAADVILEAMIDGVVVVDMNGNIIQCNSAYAKMFGFKSHEEMKEINLSGLIAERDVQRTMNAVKRCFESGITVNFEHTMKDKTGKEFPVLINASVLKDEKGEIVGAIGVTRDITELKRLQAQEFAAAVNMEKAEVIDAMPDGLIVLELNGTILSVNPAMEKMLGYTSKERVGKNFGEFGKSIKPEEIERFMKLLGELIETGHVMPVETVLRAKNGREIPMSITYSLLKDAEGNLKNIVAVLRDITGLKRVEEELEAKLKELGEFHDLAVGRELKMVELKNEMKELKKKLEAKKA